MSTYYVRLTIMNYNLCKEAQKMVKINRYTKAANGKYTKDIRIKCNCKTLDATINYIMNKFAFIAEKNKIQFKVEIFKSKRYNKKLAERLTKRYH